MSGSSLKICWALREEIESLKNNHFGLDIIGRMFLMNKEVFIEKMVDILDYEDELTLETCLEDIEEWDSLSIVSYCSMANTVCGNKIEAGVVREAKTVKDLYDLLQ